MPRQKIDPAGLPSPDPAEIAKADPHEGSAPPAVRPPLRTTQTVVELEVSEGTYREVRSKLAMADYHHTFIEDEDKGAQGTGLIDMAGIALVPNLVPDADPLTTLPKPTEDGGPLTVRAMLHGMMRDGSAQYHPKVVEALVGALKGAGEETGVAWEHGHYVLLAPNPEAGDGFET